MRAAALAGLMLAAGPPAWAGTHACGVELLGYHPGERAIYVARDQRTHSLRLRNRDVLEEVVKRVPSGLVPLVAGTGALPMVGERWEIYINHEPGAEHRIEDADFVTFTFDDQDGWEAVDAFEGPGDWQETGPGGRATAWLQGFVPELRFSHWKLPAGDVLVCGELVHRDTRAGRLVVLFRR